MGISKWFGCFMFDTKEKEIIEQENVTARSSSTSSSKLSSRRSSLESSFDTLRDSSFSSSSFEASHHTSPSYETFTKCTMTVSGTPGSSLAMVGTEELLYTGSDNNSIKVMNLFDFKTVSNFGKDVKVILVSGERVFTAHTDLSIRIWQQDDKKSLHTHVVTLPSVYDRILTSVLPNSHVRVRRHKTALRIQHYDVISTLAVGAYGNVLYSGSWDRTIKVWSIGSNKFRCVETFKAHDDAVNALVASKDGYLYSASADAKVKVWERSQENNSKHLLMASLHKHKSGINAMVLSADESFLYTASGDKSVNVWEREDSANHMYVSQVLRGHKNSVLCLAVASTGDVLCSGSADKTVRVWKRVQDGQHYCAALIQGHEAPVKSLVVLASHSSCKVFSRSLDGNLKAWCICI